MMEILFIAPGYPSENDSSFSFVQQLVEAMMRTNLVHITVIAPQSLSRVLVRGEKLKKSINEGSINILRPYVLSFSNGKLQQRINYLLVRKAIKKAAKKVFSNQKIDVVYGHFLHMGLIGSELAEKYKCVSCVACGESSINIEKYISEQYIKKYLYKIDHVICVSSETENICTNRYGINPSKCTVFVNGVDLNCFHPLGKAEAREKLNIPDNKFVVSFVGAFCERKGNERVDKALVCLQKQGYDIGSVFIGKGEFVPQSINNYYCGRLDHKDIPTYLSATDVFVLPTLAEGCCNAIVEALACGVPVISTDAPFNYDILNSDYAILIDGKQEEDIAEAIKKLYHDPELLFKMKNNALKAASTMSIEERARRIINILEK